MREAVLRRTGENLNIMRIEMDRPQSCVQKIIIEGRIGRGKRRIGMLGD